MKTRVIKQILVVIGTVMFASCEEPAPIHYPSGELTSREGLDNIFGRLRSDFSADAEVDILLTAGSETVTTNFHYQLSRPAEQPLSMTLQVATRVDDSSVVLLPSANYVFPDGLTLSVDKDKQSSPSMRLIIKAEGLAAGAYRLSFSADDGSTLTYNLTVRERYTDNVDLYTGDDLFVVVYINTAQYDPRIVTDYHVEKSKAGNSVWFKSIGNIVNLRGATIDYDAKSGRAIFNAGYDIGYLLDKRATYLLPLQEQGRKVCLCIEGGGNGLGFCNMTNQQIDDFTEQVKLLVERYDIDGINLFDRSARYGKTGMPAVNTLSYPRLIKALREKLGTDKLLTVVDYENSTSTFWNTKATGGISVGDYIDYAWSGYDNEEEAPQLLDPWHPDYKHVSAYTHKPFAGLDPSKYGCYKIAHYKATRTQEEVAKTDTSFISEWVAAGYRPNNIIVFTDLWTNLQNAYEYGSNGGEALSAFAADGRCLGNNGYWYWRDTEAINELHNGNKGYGKWLKDWY